MSLKFSPLLFLKISSKCLIISLRIKILMTIRVIFHSPMEETFLVTNRGNFRPPSKNLRSTQRLVVPWRIDGKDFLSTFGSPLEALPVTLLCLDHVGAPLACSLFRSSLPVGCNCQDTFHFFHQALCHTGQEARYLARSLLLCLLYHPLFPAQHLEHNMGEGRKEGGPVRKKERLQVSSLEIAQKPWYY